MSDEMSELAKKIIPAFPEINKPYQKVAELNKRYAFVVFVIFMGSLLYSWSLLRFGWSIITTFPYLLFLISGVYFLYHIDVKLNTALKELEDIFIIFKDSILSEDA